jgi:cell division protein FtsW (lipid II flippase)
MAFKEKSAWLMLFATLVVGLYMTYTVVQTYLKLQQVPTVLPVFIKLTVTLIILSVIGQIVLAIANRKQAEQKADEREKVFIRRGQAVAGGVLAVGVVVSLIHFLFLSDGNLLFYSCLLSLVVAQIVEYAVQIASFHRGY